MNENSFLGRGWSFPPTFTKSTVAGQAFGELLMVEDREDIEQSLTILLSTSLGERVLQPEYGCNLNDYQFEPMNASLIGRVKDIVDNAILYYEPRIRVQEISISERDSVDVNNGILQITVDYTIRITNSRFNFVYDFYLKEGIN